MSLPFEDRCYVALMTAKEAKGRSLDSVEIKQVLRIQHEISLKEWESRRKAKQKTGIDERAKAIFNLYPRREGGTAALLSITKAIDEDGFELVLAKTTEYANAVARWPRLYRYSQSKPGEPARDLVPMATTWFNQRRYNDDAQNWVRVGGAPAPKVKANLSEPLNWRLLFPDFVHVEKPWIQIDRASQEYIISACQKRQTA